MRFTLTYDGPLPSCSKKQRIPEKFAIRRCLNPQLRELCSGQPGLANWVSQYNTLKEVANARGPLLSLRSIGAFDFISLFNRRWHFLCELSVLFLRRDHPGNLITPGGDIDNRIATLFDALRVPQREVEIPRTERPLGDDEVPFFCLLEDDAQISAVSVRTEKLLTSHRPATDVRLVIDVTMTVTQLSYGTLGLA